MPPTLQFEPGEPPAVRPRRSKPEIDLAGDARPRCRLELPQATKPGLYHVACECGLLAAIAVHGEDGDPSLVLLRCWERHAVIEPTQPALFAV